MAGEQPALTQQLRQQRIADAPISQTEAKPRQVGGHGETCLHDAATERALAKRDCTPAIIAALTP